MSCTTCGSNLPCGCVNTAVGTTCGCGNSACGGCGCNSALPGTPLPFYNCAPACPENHTQRIVLQQYFTTVSITSSWNVPACGGSAIVTVQGLKSAAIGSYIWNSQFGYFEITAFDSASGQLTIVNHCNDGNAASGTNVPACTEFIVSDPPVDIPSLGDQCVAIDFTAPDDGDCLDITLTTTVGLTASDTIQIGTGFYFISEIKPNDIITICNQGQGITPGTPVIALDSNGNYQYCISVISTNPCDRTPEAQVVILGCGEDEITVPLDGNSRGWVATLLDETTNDAAYRPIGYTGDSSCTTLTATLTFVSGTTTYANVAVASSAGFAIGDVLEVEGGPGYHLTITNIPDATHIDITVSPSPGDVAFPAGNLVCESFCFESRVVVAELTGDPPVNDLLLPTQTLETTIILLTVQNASICRPMKALVTVTLSFRVAYGPGGGGGDTFDFAIRESTDGGAYGDIFATFDNGGALTVTPYDGNLGRQFTWSGTKTIAPATTVALRYKGFFRNNADDVSNTMSIGVAYVRGTVMGVAV